MKPFEITTPALVKAMQNFETATGGTLDTREAAQAIAAGNGIVKAVGQELKVRLAMPKLAAIEAKTIEHESQMAIAHG